MGQMKVSILVRSPYWYFVIRSLHGESTSLFQELHRELFLGKEKGPLLESCPHFKGVLITQVSPFQGCHWRGVPLYDVL